MELGSGVGVCGIFLAQLGACVTLTDLPAVCELLSQNCLLNEAAVACSGGRCDVRPLPWGEELSVLSDAFGTEHPDIIIASDVVYQHSSFEPLRQVLDILSSDSTPLILLSYKRRGEEEERFFEALTTLSNFQVEQVTPGDPTCENVVYRLHKTCVDQEKRKESGGVGCGEDDSSYLQVPYR